MINVRIPAEINQNLKMVHFEILRQSLFLDKQQVCIYPITPL